MNKKIFISALILLIGITFTFNACNEEVKIYKQEIQDLNNDRSLQSDIEATISKIKEMYPDLYSDKTESRNLVLMPQMECGRSSDPTVNCVGATTITVTLPILTSGKVYHPSLPPIYCTFIVSMDITFCQSSNPFSVPNTVLIFENFTISTFIYSPPCLDWFNAWVVIPEPTRSNIVRDLTNDLQEDFQKNFIDVWVSSSLNQYDYCPEGNERCSLLKQLIHAKYYQASCSKMCLVFEVECADPYGFLCRKEIPCYTDGCCKKETAYCLNPTTNKVEVCHQAYYLMGACTNPVASDPCIIEIESCTNNPQCPTKG